MTTPIPLLVDRQKTIAKFLKQGRNLSWSKFKTFKQCPMSYFIQNFVGGEVEPGLIYYNQLKALPGLLIQKFLEGYVNGRLYRYWEGKLPITYDFVWTTMEGLYDLYVAPLELQYTWFDSRKYFAAKEGKARLKKAKKDGLSEYYLKNPSLYYVDENCEYYYKKYKTKKYLIANLSERVCEVLHSFGEHKVDMDKMLSEVRVSAPFQGKSKKLTGQIDFLYDAHNPGEFVVPESVKDGYVLFDGKYTMGSTYDMDQVMFYAIALYQQYNVKPSYIGYWNWTEVKPIFYTFNESWYAGVYRQIEDTFSQIEQVQERLDKDTSKEELMDLSEPLQPFGFTPSLESCRFCKLGMANMCYRKWGYNDETGL